MLCPNDDITKIQIIFLMTQENVTCWIGAAIVSIIRFVWVLNVHKSHLFKSIGFHGEKKLLAANGIKKMFALIIRNCHLDDSLK